MGWEMERNCRVGKWHEERLGDKNELKKSFFGFPWWRSG